MSNKLHITYFFRKPRPQYFSIEKVFEQVIAVLPQNVVPHIYKLKNGTNGWWGRLMALIEVWRNKGAINHITGDITFIAMALPKKGLVVTYHDLESLTQYKGWQFSLLKYLWVSIPVKRAQVVTAISEHTKAQLLKWTGCKPEKIVVVPNPLPEELNYTPKVFDAKSPTILVMGTKANKNVEGIFEAVYKLRDERGVVRGEQQAQNTKHYQLIVVGKMNEQQKALAEHYQLEIENLVHVPYETILDAYKRCDLLCFPSFYEGFGLPIIEAQAIGRPVITSNFGAMKEVAGKGAVLVDPEKTEEIRDAIVDIVKNEESRRLLTQEGRRNIEQFEAEVIGKQYCHAYSDK